MVPPSASGSPVEGQPPNRRWKEFRRLKHPGPARRQWCPGLWALCGPGIPPSESNQVALITVGSTHQSSVRPPTRASSSPVARQQPNRRRIVRPTDTTRAGHRCRDVHELPVQTIITVIFMRTPYALFSLEVRPTDNIKEIF